MSSELILFGTDHCALCDEALELLLSMPELAGFPLTTVDVAADDALSAALGERLPVLALRRSGCPPLELDWPFDGAAVRQLLGRGQAAH
jgi:hypothetical protein